jgi:hypothetical protein
MRLGYRFSTAIGLRVRSRNDLPGGTPFYGPDKTKQHATLRPGRLYGLRLEIACISVPHEIALPAQGYNPKANRVAWPGASRVAIVGRVSHNVPSVPTLSSPSLRCPRPYVVPERPVLNWHINLAPSSRSNPTAFEAVGFQPLPLLGQSGDG